MNSRTPEVTKKPGKEDVHEQREAGQTREGVVKKDNVKPVRLPVPSQTDLDRADSEGMGQPQSDEKN